MRAKEFIVEYKKYPTQEYGGVTFTMMEKDGQLIVKALNDFGIAMGYVIFNMDGRELDPKDLEVEEKYQGQGIASTMYDYIKSQGFTINRSFDQTDAGRGFWDKHRGEDSYVWEGVDADQVLQYVKQAHAPEQFDIDSAVTDHPRWELKSIPVSRLKLDPDGEAQDPYGRVNWVDYDKVQDLMPNISAVLKRMPIVVDGQGWIIDGNHRATAAAEAGLKSVPAYVPTEVSENFADGKVKGKSRPGRVKRAGASCDGSVTSLRAKARKYGGERGKMYHWCANMKGGKKKANEEYYDGHNFYGAQIGEAIIGHLHFPNVTIAVDDHAIERTQTHGVDPKSIDVVLKKLSSIADELNQLEVNNKVWVYDPATNVALGLRRISSREPVFKLKTVVGDRPYDGQTPIINL